MDRPDLGRPHYRFLHPLRWLRLRERAIESRPHKPPEHPGIFTVVLTGGIASGKTTVSNLFARRGVPVIDTDQVARQVVEPGQPGLDRIVESFGPECLDADGNLDRNRMRQLIFADPAMKARLEAILHPLIRQQATALIRRVRGPYCLLVIPLFAESGAYAWVDRVLVVDVPEEVQLERVMARDRIKRGQAESILAAQAGRQERLALADDVLDNSGSPDDLERQVEALHKKYLGLA